MLKVKIKSEKREKRIMNKREAALMIEKFFL